MKVLGDLHTHTVFSHGKGTIKENVTEGRNKNLAYLGIADHGPASFRIGINGEKDLHRMRREINGLNLTFEDLDIYLGIEANIISLDGTIDVSEGMLKYLDMIFIGFHLMVNPGNFSDFKNLILPNIFSKAIPMHIPPLRKKIGEPMSTSTRRKNTLALLRAVEKYEDQIYMITHPGLHMDIDTYELSKACGENDVKLEINCSHASKIESYVKAAADACSEVEFVLSSDAHKPTEVGDVVSGIKMCKKIGLPLKRVINLCEE